MGAEFVLHPFIEAPCSPPEADYGECARWSIFKLDMENGEGKIVYFRRQFFTQLSKLT